MKVRIPDLVFVTIFGIVAGAGMMPATAGNDEAERSPQPFDSSYPWIRGFEIKEYGPDGIIIAARADSLFIAPRRIFFFNVKSINEVRLDNAQVEVHFPADPSAGLELLPFGVDSFGFGGGVRKKSSKPFGTITRTVVDRIDISFFRAEKLMLTLSAARADIEKKAVNPRFRAAVLTSAISGMKIISEEMFWDVERKRFVIPGPYIAQSAEDRASGAGIVVDLDFKVSPL
jgi:hypothetical protein